MSWVWFGLGCLVVFAAVVSAADAVAAFFPFFFFFLKKRIVGSKDTKAYFYFLGGIGEKGELYMEVGGPQEGVLELEAEGGGGNGSVV